MAPKSKRPGSVPPAGRPEEAPGGQPPGARDAEPQDSTTGTGLPTEAHGTGLVDAAAAAGRLDVDEGGAGELAREPGRGSGEPGPHEPTMSDPVDAGARGAGTLTGGLAAVAEGEVLEDERRGEVSSGDAGGRC